MSQDPYLESIKDTFSNLDIGQFTVHYAEQIIFICGGIYEHQHAYPQSLRERILLHLDATHEDLSRNRVLAEDFKDYFLHGRYDDLMQFEVDIANISSLIVICMESPGSLVEFGLFCGHVETAKKLLVFMPEEHYEDVDSFITLGPISDIKKRSIDSVCAYPFPDANRQHYEHISSVVGDIISRLGSCHKKEKFNQNDSGHLAFLIYDIASLYEPIKKNEIKVALSYLGISDLSDERISNLLYLLKKIRLIEQITYGSVDYYWASNSGDCRVTFGKYKNKQDRLFDRKTKFLEIRQTIYEEKNGESDIIRKRRLAMKKIQAKREAK